MKKKIVKKPVNVESEPTELPIINKKLDEDVDEDHPVFDMSDVPTPVITPFELPKPKADEKKKSAKGDTKKKTKEALTAEKLNDEITKIRSVVVTAKTRLIKKLVRKKKELEGKVNKLKDEKKNVQFGRQANRISEELDNVSGLDRDTVAKFAFLNQKPLNDLINATTIASERLMYKLACHELITNAVDSLREKYTDFNKTAAFFMQRLGLQYAEKKTEKEKKVTTRKAGLLVKNEEDISEEIKKDEKESEEAEEDTEEDDDDDDEDDEHDDDDDEDDEHDDDDGESYDMSDVEMVNSDEDEEAEAVHKRRELLLGLIGVSMDKSRSEIKPKKRKLEEDEDEVKVKAPSKKETAKSEMKKVLEKELKASEAKKPKVQKKQVKKVPASLVKKDKEATEKHLIDDDSEPQALIKRIDLSAGGKIEKSSSKPVEKRNEKNVDVKDDDNEDEEDEEENAFFLPKTGNVEKRATRTVETRSSKRFVKDEPKKVSVPDEKKKKGVSKKAILTGKEHPSWAASQQKKLAMQQAKPCGKKITFGDDD